MTQARTRVALVTGATSGIGRQTALTLAARGVAVMATGRNVASGNATVDAITAAGGRARFFAMDVTSEEAWKACLEETLKHFGGLDVLVNNAGESVSNTIGALQILELLFLLAVNVDGCFLGMKHAIPVMEAGGGGCIVNVSSVAALRATPRNTIYGASKAAMTGLTDGIAVELARQGSPVRVISLHPGLIWGPGVEESRGKEGAQQFLDIILPKTPLGRVGVPEDIAEVIAHIVEQSSVLTSGQRIVVDGGLQLSFP